jgi:hypothetical protein
MGIGLRQQEKKSHRPPCAGLGGLDKFKIPSGVISMIVGGTCFTKEESARK